MLKNKWCIRFFSLVGTWQLLVLSSSVSALEYKYESYVGLHALNLEYSEEAVAEDFNLRAIYARFGARFDDWYAIEWRMGRGVGSDEVSANAEIQELSQGMFYGAYFLSGYTWKSLFGYVLLGASQMKVELTGAGAADVELETSGLSYGIGLDLKFSQHFGANIEYTQYTIKNDIDLSGLSAGLSYLF